MRTFFLIYLKQWLGNRYHGLFLLRTFTLWKGQLVMNIFCLNLIGFTILYLYFWFLFKLWPIRFILALINVIVIAFSLVYIWCPILNSDILTNFSAIFIDMNFDGLAAFLAFEYILDTIINNSSHNLIFVQNHWACLIIRKLLSFLFTLQINCAIRLYDNGNGQIVFIILKWTEMVLDFIFGNVEFRGGVETSLDFRY